MAAMTATLPGLPAAEVVCSTAAATDSSHCVENHHPERLAQASVPKRNCGSALRKSAFSLIAARPRRNPDIARDRTDAAKAGGVSEFCYQTGRRLMARPH